MVRLDDLSAEQIFALAAIVKGKLAWSSAAEMEDAGVAADTIEGLVGLGLVDRWGQPYVGHIAEDRVTLNPYAAWLLEVHILERTSIVGDELSEDPYWAETSQEPRSIHLPKRRHEIRWPWMDEVPDPKSLRRAGEVMRDEEGEPVKVLGMEVPVDHRLKGKGGAKQPKARRRAG